MEYKYCHLYFKGGCKVTCRIDSIKVGYNPYIKSHPVSITILPLESIWTGNLHLTSHHPVTFNLWDLKQVVSVKDWLCSESSTKNFLTVLEHPIRFYYYWKCIANKLEEYSKGEK